MPMNQRWLRGQARLVTGEGKERGRRREGGESHINAQLSLISRTKTGHQPENHSDKVQPVWRHLVAKIKAGQEM